MGRFAKKLAAVKLAGIQDESEGQLRDLMARGYTDVMWNKSWDPCPHCINLHGRRWRLIDFVANLRFSAPVFEKSHPNCRCSVIVSGPNLSDEEVLAF